MADRQLRLFDARIRFAPDILRRLGEELNPSPDQGILELVRNAYDADARSCTVELSHADQQAGSIRVVDDGDGMTEEQITHGWLVLGKSIKSAQTRTRLGRVPAGNKGLGRLAALRMGDQVAMVTRPREEPSWQYELVINWREYEEVKLIDEVELKITRSPRKKAAGKGTEITVHNLHQRVGRMDVKRLSRAMILLADPFGDDNLSGFEPVLCAPEFSDLEALVKGRYFSDAEYHLIAELDQQGQASASVVDWRGNRLFATEHRELAANRSDRSYACPPARLDFWAYLLNTNVFSTRTTSLGEVRDWLQAFGGVHFYHNGLRVTPYGNPGNDWLDINLRRAQSPEERPSTNNSIGRVAVNDPSETLVQKTDRSGFIENDAFLELKAFAQDALEWMARRRLEIAQRRRTAERREAPKRAKQNRKKLEEAIDQAPKDAQPPLREAVDAYQRSHDKEVAQLRKEVQLYRTLSTAGITAATFAHESSGNPIKVIHGSINAIERAAKRLLGSQYDSALQRPVERIKSATDGLGVLGAATLKLLAHEKRRPSKVEVHKMLRNVAETFAPFLAGRDVTLEMQLCSGEPYLRATEAAVESIVTNLLNNSLAAFEQSDCSQRRIVLRTEVEDGGILRLRVLDNGPGIRDISSKDIWLPGVTTRKNGTGLGLTIVRDAATDLGGHVEAIEKSELGGAEIRIELPILGV